MNDLYECPRCRQLNSLEEVLEVRVNGVVHWMCSCCAGIYHVIEYEPVSPQSAP